MSRHSAPIYITNSQKRRAKKCVLSLKKSIRIAIQKRKTLTMYNYNMYYNYAMYNVHIYIIDIFAEIGVKLSISKKLCRGNQNFIRQSISSGMVFRLSDIWSKRCYINTNIFLFNLLIFFGQFYLENSRFHAATSADTWLKYTKIIIQNYVNAINLNSAI